MIDGWCFIQHTQSHPGCREQTASDIQGHPVAARTVTRAEVLSFGNVQGVAVPGSERTDKDVRNSPDKVDKSVSKPDQSNVPNFSPDIIEDPGPIHSQSRTCSRQNKAQTVLQFDYLRGETKKPQSTTETHNSHQESNLSSARAAILHHNHTSFH